MTTPATSVPLEPEMLPGLADPPPMSGPVVAGVRRTLAQLAAERTLTERDAGKMALALTMAEVLEQKQRSGRGLSTIGMDARVLFDILEGMDSTDADADGALSAAMDEWARTIADLEGEASNAGAPD